MDALLKYLQGVTVPITVSLASDPERRLSFANEAFSKLTGFDQDFAIGKNCRFLQCEETDPESRRRMRAALDAREGVAICLLNQRKSGERFHNLVCINPAMARDGTEVYIGCQFELRRHIGIDSVEEHVRGVMRMLSAYPTSSDLERTRLEAVKMRFENVMMVVRAYEGWTPSAKGARSF